MDLVKKREVNKITEDLGLWFFVIIVILLFTSTKINLV